MARAMKDSGFDWIGQIPESWDVLPAQRGFTEIKRKNSDGAVQKALQFKFGTIVPKINFDAESDDYVADTITAYNIVEPGTVMINGLNLNYDFKTQRSALVKETGVITSAYLALWPNASMIISEYATYLFKGYEAKMAFHNMGSGIRLTLGWKEFKKQPVLFPTITEQKRIVGFLDRRCAEIDSVIADTQRTIEEYKKLKQSVITQAVTRGVRGERLLKNSGIEWIGDIPSDWNISRLKYVCQINTEFVDPRTGEYDELPHIGPGNIEKFTGRLTEYKLVKDEGLISGKYHFYPNDIVYGKINPQLGKVAFPQFEGLCSADAYPIHTIGESMETRFLLYFMLSRIFIDATILESLRMGMPKINSTDLMGLSITVPSIEEQKEIVDYIDARSQEMDLLIDAKQQMLEALEAYKKSVIYEYVTGKKEVPACQ